LVPFLAEEALDPFLAGALDVVALDIVGSDVLDVVDVVDVVDLNPLALASCAARLAKSSCLLEQPVCCKIRLIVGDVSSSTIARDRIVVASEAIAVVALVAVREGGIEMRAVDGQEGRLLDGNGRALAYGFGMMRLPRRGGALPLAIDGSFSLFLW